MLILFPLYGLLACGAPGVPASVERLVPAPSSFHEAAQGIYLSIITLSSLESKKQVGEVVDWVVNNLSSFFCVHVIKILTVGKTVKFALSSLGGSPWESSRLRLAAPAKDAKFSAVELERYARARWDSVLHFMVGSTAVQEPPQSVVDILLRTKLMKQSADSRALHITDTGYEFMLKDIHVQMWIFMLEYIRTLDNTGTLRQEDILQFLFQISYCQTNEYYAVADLTQTQQLLLGDFIDFGLLFRQRTSSDRFYTTSLAVNLIFGGSTGQKRVLAPSHVSV